MKSITSILMYGCAIAALSGCSGRQEDQGTVSDLEHMISRFAPTVISADTSALSPGDKLALGKLVEAAALMDRIYARQVWSGNEALLAKLEADTTQIGRLRLEYFRLNGAPWSKLDGDTAFLPGVPAHRPPQANYYPDDMTKQEFTAWAATLPDSARKQATGFFTVIRRDAAGKLMMVPYSAEYQDLLIPAAQLLRDAAALTDNPSLKEFLAKRADAFLSNDYYESDIAWMDLDSPIDVTIGPYEVYMDDLFNDKAAFEAFIGLRDDAESAKLSRFSGYLQDIENHLPIEARYRNPKLGALSPIRVVDEIATGGEARPGVQTAAFNLPNDERVTAEKGSKRVMLKNVQEAKFNTILTPIAAMVLDSSQLPLVAFDPFFTHILAHELMHGLGPHTIVVNGKTTTVRQEMRELSSALEEAKADISGLFALQYLIDKGVVDTAMGRRLPVTFLASIFRSVRFGINEAHGKGVALQFNYLSDEGAFRYDSASGRFSVDFTRIKAAVAKLTGEIMTIQAEGSYEKAKKLLDHYGVIRPEMQKALDRLAVLPVDIAPEYPMAR